MSGDDSMIYHIATKKDWESAQAIGKYTISTLGRSFRSVGFIHFSFKEQVPYIIDLLYKNRNDLVILAVDRKKLDDKLLVELSGNDYYPHYYAELLVEQVSEVLHPSSFQKKPTN